MTSKHAFPVPNGTKRASVELASSLLPPGAPPASFDGGSFLKDIRNNWLDGDPNTRLSGELMAQVEALPWFAAWLEGVRKRRQ